MNTVHLVGKVASPIRLQEFPASGGGSPHAKASFLIAVRRAVGRRAEGKRLSDGLLLGRPVTSFDSNRDSNASESVRIQADTGGQIIVTALANGPSGSSQLDPKADP
jgi:hypothetical protein